MSVGLPLCRLAGSVWYVSAPAARAAVRDNLRHILGREPSRRQVQAVFINGALNYWDTLAIPHLNRKQLRDMVTLRGLEHVDAALAQGKGAILVSAHLGSVSLVGQAVPAIGYPILSLVEQIEPRRLYEFFTHQRERFGVRLLPASGAALRELLAALRRNEIVGLISDRDVSGNGLFADFFDAPARFPEGPAALAVRTGAPILPAVVVRRPDGHFDAIIEPPLAMPATPDTRANVLQLTQAMARHLQYHIANHPEQWTVFQRRWPTGPGAMSSGP
jgi:KDO2-lipid IV(A) lauroyltransferase